MNISVQKLLGKIEQELNQAKASSSEARIRERIHAIKALCELVLEDSAAKTPTLTQPSSYIPAPVVQTPSVSMPQPRKIEMEDDANGDSLFDF